ncbi:hypothetical protein SLS62_001509 [Diatrype stigma]|uniref:Uncharacterized protein n=1 Tax=Diatrype stigma TaxID=117547 RepID=A0AAN9UXQ5_9PEZI
MITPTQAPFALHAVVETAAALSFIFTPEKQLPACSPAARLILRQYGGLLLSSSAVCLAVLLLEPAEPGFGNSSSTTCRWIAAALGTYHVWPCYRAYARLRIANVGGRGLTSPEKEEENKTDSSSTLGGPVAHLAVHLICLGGFACAFAFGDWSQ